MLLVRNLSCAYAETSEDSEAKNSEFGLNINTWAAPSKKSPWRTWLLASYLGPTVRLRRGLMVQEPRESWARASLCHCVPIQVKLSSFPFKKEKVQLNSFKKSPAELNEFEEQI